MSLGIHCIHVTEGEINEGILSLIDVCALPFTLKKGNITAFRRLLLPL